MRVWGGGLPRRLGRLRMTEKWERCRGATVEITKNERGL